MKNIYTLLIMAFLSPLLSKAQSNYKPGYVVNLKGDTLKGFIDYHEWSKNPREFSFKSDINSTTSENYSISNALSFAVNGFEHYQRYYVSISQDRTEISQLTVGVDTTTLKDTVFLRIITTGKNLTLFTFKDAIKVRFFAAERNNDPVELILHLYFDTDQKSKIVNSTGYRRQLQRWATIYQPNDRNIQDAIQAAGYLLHDITKVVNEINGVDASLEAVYDRQGHHFFAGVGLNRSVIGFKGQTNLVNGKGHLALFPKINGGIDVFFNNNVKKVFFRTELSFTGNSTNIVAEGVDNVPYIQTLKFKQYIASLNPQILLNAYNTNKIKVNIGAGLAINYSIYTNKESRSAYFLTNQPVWSENTEFPDVQSLYFNATTNLGVILNNKLQIYVSYSPATVLNVNLNYKMNSTSYQAGINYFFGSK